MSATTVVQRVLGQEKIADCFAHIQELVNVWMKDNDVHRWEDIVSPREFEVADDDYHFQVRQGATKIVIVPDEAHYVIKIPFIGEESWGDRDFYYFDGGDYDNDSFDYCEHEAYLYEQAEYFKCDQFFVPTIYIFDVENIPIYIQTKIKGLRSSSQPSNEDTYRYASIKNSDVLIPEVGAKLLQYYSMDEVANFLAFIKAFQVNDLEAARNGEYVEAFGRYVFWDYSGYKEYEF